MTKKIWCPYPPTYKNSEARALCKRKNCDLKFSVCKKNLCSDRPAKNSESTVLFKLKNSENFLPQIEHYQKKLVPRLPL